MTVSASCLRRPLARLLGPACLSLTLALAPAAQACTSLIYRDANGAVYFGRTLELAMALPYRVAYIPAGQRYSSTAAAGAAALAYTTKYRMLAITVPNGTLDDLKIVEGFNEKGLTFSLLAFAGAAGPGRSFEMTKAALSAIDLGSWTLGQFQDVAEVKAALASQPVLLAPLAVLGNAKSPFHYVLHDRSGASIVIEFADGKQTVYDNPVGVMTNGPELPWHLANLNNYTFLSNVDQSSGQFGALKVAQPDSGIATAGLPASNTSVGRFVRAVYYSQYAQKVTAPDDAVRTLAHIMNNFDRPKDITIDTNAGGNEGIAAVATKDSPPFTSEYTSWTALTDLNRSVLYVRTYGGLNYSTFDLTRLAAGQAVLSLPLATLDGMAGDATAALIAAKTP